MMLWKSKNRLRRRKRRPRFQGFLQGCIRSRRTIFGGLLVSFMMVFAYFAYGFATTSSHFAVSGFKIDGLARTDGENVRSFAETVRGKNIFQIPMGEIADDLQKLPWAKEVSLERDLPDTVTIRVTEYIPRGILVLDAMYWFDHSGTPFKRVEGTDDIDGVLVVNGFARAEFSADPKEAARAVQDVISVCDHFKTVTGLSPSEVTLSGQRLSLWSESRDLTVNIPYASSDAMEESIGKFYDASKSTVEPIQKAYVRTDGKQVVFRLHPPQVEKIHG